MRLDFIGEDDLRTFEGWLTMCGGLASRAALATLLLMLPACGSKSHESNGGGSDNSRLYPGVDHWSCFEDPPEPTLQGAQPECDCYGLGAGEDSSAGGTQVAVCGSYDDCGSYVDGRTGMTVCACTNEGISTTGSDEEIESFLSNCPPF